MVHMNRHFIISPMSQQATTLNRSSNVCGWSVGLGEDIRLHPIVDDQGQSVGAVIGWLISDSGLVDDGVSIPGPKVNEKYHDWSLEFCGRFVCIYPEGGGHKFYLDAGGLLGAVYSPEYRTIASVPNLIPAATKSETIVSLIDTDKKFGWYPFGITPYENIYRLLPNHHICMEEFTSSRFWPMQPVVEQDAEYCVKNIIRLVKNNIKKISDSTNVIAHLTAGYDSRMILAAAWPVRNRIKFVTIDEIPGTHSNLDSDTAAHIAKKFGLSHESRTFLELTVEDRLEWLERTGYCIADHVTSLATTLKSWFRDETQLGGTSGEIARAFYWTSRDIYAKRPDATEVLRRIKAPISSPTLDAAHHWLNHYDGCDAPFVWDMIYLEQRLGCWAGPAVYGAIQPIPSISPFNSRAVYSEMLSLPVFLPARR